MTFTNEQLIKAKSAKTAEELLRVAKGSGIEMTAEEAKKYFTELHKEGALTDDELGMVAGGASSGSSGTEYSDSSIEFIAVQGGICPHCRGNLTEKGGFGCGGGFGEYSSSTEYWCYDCRLAYEIVCVGEESIPLNHSGYIIRKIYKMVEHSLHFGYY